MPSLTITLIRVCVCVCADADFVGSVLLKESVNSSVGDDDKMYFFFREKSQEQTAYPSQTRVSRVARVCKVPYYTSSLMDVFSTCGVQACGVVCSFC